MAVDGKTISEPPDPSEIEREVEETVSLIQKRNEEINERKDPKPLFIPPKIQIHLAVEHGHNAEQIVNALTRDRDNPLVYRFMRENYSPPYEPI